MVEILSVEEYAWPGRTEKLLGLSDVPGAFPGEGEIEAVSDTVPVNPRLVKLIDEVDEPPATKLDGEGGPAEI